ncbi:hypothetical protein EJ05DRAFT_499525 [Pseudovirgaria hyperparasitica]|uniref:Ams2/SPT21 N-terminal domain-containing protein n=1 Tax=Pseudovirgaria hyperparasitica TaxID=470096 RepID=A0A6A6WDB7_9PEZI|nr:uncharacterized protein EJ05DRAFT_499525 [Pseudovirgaria hyperparasitica]KAF2759101.1 hypothetical protein EJ05DRAFT_499525 [Pseudovirgaria hyperparasitica]
MSSAGSSPVAMHNVAGPDEDDPEIPRRLMQVKVNYSFDENNNINCLARLPHPMNIPTVQMDDLVHVGLIELRTCIQAIMQRSPELVGKLNSHDYTVYAYDYSELDTPLVGQGMLSWVLAAISPNSNAPAHESKTMVTGRVCKTAMAAFTKGPRETLDVKLKLVPVPALVQKEYVDNMETYRSLSQVHLGKYDTSSLPMFMRETSGGDVSQQFIRGSSPLPQTRPASQRDNSRDIESVHQLLRQNSFSDGPSPFQQDSYTPNQFTSQTSRGPSPAPSYHSSSTFQQGLDAMSRPDSRGSNRSERPAQGRMDSFESATMSDAQDEPPVKKRVHTTKVKSRSKSAFGVNSDSLLQTASTANSVRVYRPTPLGAGQPVHQSVEPPPRVPTPRPGNIPEPVRRRLSNGTSLLRQASFASSNREGSEIGTDGPDDAGSIISETPMDFPSSPPEIRYDNDTPPPSSPQLPAKPCPVDSGFVSDCNVDSEGPVKVVKPLYHQHVTNILDETKDPSVPIARPWPPVEYRNQHQPWMAVMPGPASALPTTMRYTQNLNRPRQNPMGRPAPPKAPSKASSKGPATVPSVVPQPQKPGTYTSPYAQLPPQSTPSSDQRATDSKHSISENGSVASGLAEPTVPSQNARKSTISQGSDAGSISSAKPAQSKSTAKSLRSLGATRKKILGKHLEECLATGEVPRYCGNCGEIQTSTWRRAYTAVYQGTPNNVTLTKNFFEEGGVVGVEVILKEDPTAPSTEYRVYKKRPTQFEMDQGHVELVSLCNPCGLWFDKYGNMRPPERWVDQRTKKPKSKAPSKPRPRKLQSKDNQSGLTFELSQEPQPALHTGNNVTEDICPTMPEPPAELIQKRPRAASIGTERSEKLQRTQWAGDVAAAALQRAIQSSPARHIGSQQSPIVLESDLTPKPVRRSLFPSPRKMGEFKALGDGVSPQKFASPTSVYATDAPTTVAPTPSESDIADSDKENCAPANNDDGLGDLFGDGDNFSDIFKTPKSQPRVRSAVSSASKNWTPTTPSRRSRNPLTHLSPKAPASNSKIAALDLQLATPSRRSVRRGSICMSDNINAILTDIRSTPSRNNDLWYFTDPEHPTTGLSEDLFADYMESDWPANMDTDAAFSSDMLMPSSDGPEYFKLYEDFHGGDSAITWSLDHTFIMDNQESTGRSVVHVETDDKERVPPVANTDVSQCENVSSKKVHVAQDFDALLESMGRGEDTELHSHHLPQESVKQIEADGMDTGGREEEPVHLIDNAGTFVS